MTELTGSAARRLERAVAVQGFDARTFDGARILRLLLPPSRKSGASYKQLFILNVSDRSLADAFGLARWPESRIVSYDAFDPPPQDGPALIGTRDIPVGTVSDGARYLAKATVKKLALVPAPPDRVPSFPGPFSVATQAAAAGLQVGPGTSLFGVRLLRAGSDRVVEEIFSVMATSRDAAAAAVLQTRSDRDIVGGRMSIEVEDTLFDRPYDNNTVLILEHKSRLSVGDFMDQQQLSELH